VKPLRLKFLRRQVAQRRMAAVALIDISEAATAWLVGRLKVGVRVAGHLFCLDGTHEGLRIAMLGGLTHGRHPALGADPSQGLDRRRRGILHPRVGVMDRRSMLPQGPPPRGQGQRLVQRAAEGPAADAACLHVHQHGQGHKPLGHPHIGDVAHPDVVGAHHRQALHQVRVARVGMGALRRPRAARGALSLEAPLAHEPRRMLRVDREARTS
jgi:hypothetical protein